MIDYYDYDYDYQYFDATVICATQLSGTNDHAMAQCRVNLSSNLSTCW